MKIDKRVSQINIDNNLDIEIDITNIEIEFIRVMD
jgi:hypothetical protein